jgi:hypothetical protein
LGTFWIWLWDLLGFFVPWQEDSLRKKMRARRVVVGLWLGFLWFLFYSLCFLPLLILDFFSCKNEQYIFVSCVWVFFFRLFWFFFLVIACWLRSYLGVL